MMICSWQSMCAVNYVDLTVYKKYSYAPSPTNALEKEVDKIWNSFKSSLNENFVSNSINTEEFWNTLRSSLDDGTFHNRIANIQTADNKTGSDIFMQNIYRSIDQIAVKYQTVAPTGDSIWVSGKLFLPKNKNAKNIIIASHYTICANSEAPSNANSIEGIFATKDYIVLMPDYIGYGISDSLTHPYLHLNSTVRSAIDLLKAAIPYLNANSYTYRKPLILVGYSQGAAATLALQKELENEYANEFTIYKTYAGAGPYDLAETFNFYTNYPSTNIPCSLPMLILGMNYGENLGLDREEFFQPILLEQCPLLIESKIHSMNTVNIALGNDITQLLKPIIFYKDSFPTSVLFNAVEKNSIIKWTPKSYLYLFHSTRDDMVPFLNSENLKSEFDSQQLDNIQYDFAPYGNHMTAAVTFFEKVYKSL